MKFLLILSFATVAVMAATPAKDIKSSPPTFEYEEYQPNDGSARPGNPGTFTSKGPESNLPETNLELNNVPEADLENKMQAEEAEFDDEVLK